MNNLSKLVAKIPEGMDGILISSQVNRKYFTGLSSSAGILLVTREKSYFLIDFRYIEIAKKVIDSAEVILLENLSKQLKELAQKHNIKTLGVENANITVEEYLKYKAIFDGVEIPQNMVVSDIIMSLRVIKSRDEINCLLKAQSFAEKAFIELLNYIKVGKSERELAAYLEYHMKLEGAEGLSFSTIAVSGANSSMPHGVPSDKLIEAGDFITFDFGAIYNGYGSDMTRTVAVSHVTEKMELVYDTVLKAQLAAMDVIKAGVRCFDVDKASRDLIYGAGFEGKFGHGLGHAIGLEVHEEPRFSNAPNNNAVCEVGHIMSVEPGIYLPGEFGVRIEDMIVVTENGHENLTTSEKKLLIL